MNYKVAYAIGFHPWEDAENCPHFSGRLLDLVADEEAGRAAPHGRALDIGTGSAIWAVALAKRGWQVTGVDIIGRALERGRQRAAAADVTLDLVHADVTELTKAGIGSGYRLVVDTGTFHDFDPQQQVAMGRGIDAIATPDACVILTVWPRRRRPLIRGATRDEIEAAFPGWVVKDAGPTGYQPPKVLDAILRSDERFYVLHRA